MKTLSDRKADLEGQSADCIADVLFCLTFVWKLHRRAESQFISIQLMSITA